MQQDKEKKLHFYIVLGEIIKCYRLKLNISLRRFADEFDLDRGNLSRIEKGKSGCNIVTLWKICEALGITFAELEMKLREKLGENFTFIDI